MVKYINGKRHSINPKCPVHIDLLDDFFNCQKCSLRLVRPHEFSNSLSKIMCLTDEVFQSDTGCNAYITPYPNASSKNKEQGFAPHYDDIDAFLIQLEGQKHWELYKSNDPMDLLALSSSSDFTPEQVSKMTKVWSGTLKKGDVLYMPRGIVHQGSTKMEDVKGGTHSLHVTISNQ